MPPSKHLSLKSFVLALGVGATFAASAVSLTESEARRFLGQSSFGPTDAAVTELMALGRLAWLQKQYSLTSSDFVGVPYMDHNADVGCPKLPAAASTPATGPDPSAICRRDHYTLFQVQRQFFANAINQPDQLRQRMALALSEILVVSGKVIRLPYAMAAYQRIFLHHAFGNFRDVLEEVTRSPAMGRFLNMANNDKPNLARGIQPNENYAREVLQLFSIGLWELNLDGTPKLDATGQPKPSYDQASVEGFAHAFTGWTYAPRPGATRNRFPNPPYFDAPMVAFAEHHDRGAKQLLGGVTLPAGQSAEADLTAAIDNIFNHPNVGPFIGRQLIQQLVTANPSPAYVERVSRAFNANPRGSMMNVLTAILTDAEASAPLQPQIFGKLREPILQLTHLMRSMNGVSDGVWLRTQAAALGQPVYSPPSVFSFFPPDFDLPDDSTLDGPAFGVFNASAAFKLSAVMSTALNGKGVPPEASVSGAVGTKIDLTAWQARAAQPAELVAAINRVLLAGRMSSGLQTALMKAAQIAPATKPLDRAKAALFLATMSPEYLVDN